MLPLSLAAVFCPHLFRFPSTITNTPLLGRDSLLMMNDSSHVLLYILFLLVFFGAQTDDAWLGDGAWRANIKKPGRQEATRIWPVPSLSDSKRPSLSLGGLPLITFFVSFHDSSTLVTTRDREETAWPQVIMGVLLTFSFACFLLVYGLTMRS